MVAPCRCWPCCWPQVYQMLILAYPLPYWHCCKPHMPHVPALPNHIFVRQTTISGPLMWCNDILWGDPRESRASQGLGTLHRGAHAVMAGQHGQLARFATNERYFVQMQVPTLPLTKQITHLPVFALRR